MNREIKFRGVRKFQPNEHPYSSFIYGHLFRHADGEYAMFIPDVGSERLIEESIGQYTGLKDKNGVEIYEGDIIRYIATYPIGRPKEAKTEQVFWQDFRAGWATKRIEFANNDLFKCAQYGNQIEVIGNIYENPELLTA